MIILNVHTLLCILSITAYRKEKVSERYFLADRNSEALSKDMVIITKYDIESNEEHTVQIPEDRYAYSGGNGTSSSVWIS